MLAFLFILAVADGAPITVQMETSPRGVASGKG